MHKQADENRKAEKHQVAVATSNLKKQRAEMEFGKQIANTLPPNFDLASLNSLLSGAAPQLDEAALYQRAEDSINAARLERR